MRVLQYYGRGRRDTLLAAVAGLRAARGLAVRVGPLDLRLLSAYGLVVGGRDADVEAFEEAMAKEAERLGIEVEPVEFAGQFE